MKSVGGNTEKFRGPQVATTGVGVDLCSAKQLLIEVPCYRAAVHVIILDSRCLIAEARSCITIQTDEVSFT
jgi:hypothetical protein